MAVFYNQTCDRWDGTYVPRKFQFMKPAQIRLRNPDGTTVVMGYGIGELIEFSLPKDTGCLVNHGNSVMEEVPLMNGSVMIEWPKNMELGYIRN